MKRKTWKRAKALVWFFTGQRMGEWMGGMIERTVDGVFKKRKKPREDEGEDGGEDNDPGEGEEDGGDEGEASA